MAIVFDTHAELEAFCEAFELRETRQKPIRKPRQKFKPVAIDYEDIMETSLTLSEEPSDTEEVSNPLPVDAELMPFIGFSEDFPIELAS